MIDEFTEQRDNLGDRQYYIYFILCIDPVVESLPKVELYVGTTSDIDLRKMTQLEGDQIINGNVYHQAERLKQFKTRIWLTAIPCKRSGCNFSYAAGQESAWFYLLSRILSIIGIGVYSK